MSNPDDPKKPTPPPTIHWDPAQEAPETEEEKTLGPEKPPDSAATMQWDPTQVPGPGDPEGPASPQLGSEDAAPSEPPQPPSPPEEDPQDDPLVGQLLRDKWEVLKRLGAGSFGTVYKVRDVKGGWVEALKILGVDRITGSEADTVRKRFLREAQIMKRLGTQSPHIVGLSTYEEDLESGLVYFLMEFVEGKSLGDALTEEGPFDVARTLNLALQVCDALIVAHHGEEGVVHRDLKLENIMLTRDRSGDEVAKVLDFGIAKIAEREADSRLTTTGTLGTPGFAAPEQLRAEEVDGRTDLFAFGVILYSLLTGRDPWFGNPAGESTTQIYELMVATERAEMIPFAQTGADVPAALATVVARLLRRDPNQRFQSAKELKSVLQELARGGDALVSGFLTVLSERPGVEVVVRAGRKVVAQGPTPCQAAGIPEGSYRVAIQDPRFEPAEMLVELGPGAMEEVTVVATPRKGGLGATLARRKGSLVLAVVFVLALAVLGLVRPWGRTLSLSELEARAASGDVTIVHLLPGRLQGSLATLGLPAPFSVSLEGVDETDLVASLRSLGLEVDTSREVARLIRDAQTAQRRMTYYGDPGSDVKSLALQARALDPESREAHSLLLKVAERLAWDADASIQEGDPEGARELARECLQLFPDHQGCLAFLEDEG